jgi:hypothetical protein
MLTPTRTRFAWAVLLGALALASAAAMEWTGRASRTAFERPAIAGSSRWIAVRDAGEAVRVLGEGGVHGRQLLLLTGRWPNVRSAGFEPGAAADGSPPPADLIDADTATIAAARFAIGRELHVIMAPQAYGARLHAVQAAKELVSGEGWFAVPFHGYERHFWLPDAFRAPPEPLVAIVEPSFFVDDAPADVDAWLRQRGAELEVGLVALGDPAASSEQLGRAAAFADLHGAVALEVHR